MEIGATLRAARQAQGWSLADAESGTRIRARFLQALEEEEWAILGRDVYVRGFLRNYATFLGLDPEPLLDALGGAAALQRQAERTPRYLTEPLQPNPLPIGRIVATLALLLLLGVAGVALWGQPAWRDTLLGRIGLAPLVATATPTPPASAGVPVAASTETSEAAPESSPTAATPIATAVPTASLPPRTPTRNANATPTALATTTATPAPSVEGVVIDAEILSDTWVRVFVDASDQPEIERVLRVGETFQWTAQQEISVRAGNAAGIRLTLNGQDIGTLGGPGEVVERRWQRDPNGGPPQLVDPQG